MTMSPYSSQSSMHHCGAGAREQTALLAGRSSLTLCSALIQSSCLSGGAAEAPHEPPFVLRRPRAAWDHCSGRPAARRLRRADLAAGAGRGAGLSRCVRDWVEGRSGHHDRLARIRLPAGGRSAGRGATAAPDGTAGCGGAYCSARGVPISSACPAAASGSRGGCCLRCQWRRAPGLRRRASGAAEAAAAAAAVVAAATAGACRPRVSRVHRRPARRHLASLRPLRHLRRLYSAAAPAAAGRAAVPHMPPAHPSRRRWHPVGGGRPVGVVRGAHCSGCSGGGGRSGGGRGGGGGCRNGAYRDHSTIQPSPGSTRGHRRASPNRAVPAGWPRVVRAPFTTAAALPAAGIGFTGHHRMRHFDFVFARRRLLIYPNGNQCHHLSLYLQSTENIPSGWEIHEGFALTLVCIADERLNVTKGAAAEELTKRPPYGESEFATVLISQQVSLSHLTIPPCRRSRAVSVLCARDGLVSAESLPCSALACFHH